nr:nucleotide pyrophosphohydrolase [Terrilactibacillus laevilacticus]
MFWEARDLNQLSIKGMQKEVDEYISQFKEGYFSPLAMTARLTEELGELAREINHYYGEKKKKASEGEKAIDEELGDLLFVLTCLANSLDIDMEKSFKMVMNKFNTRDKNRWTRIDAQEEKS